MAEIAGQLQTFNLGLLLGELYKITPTETPFLSMIGGLNGGASTEAVEFVWQTVDNRAAGQNTKLEGADATFSGRDTTSSGNVVQIHHEGLEISYTRLGTVKQLSSAAPNLLAEQPIQDIRAFQTELKFEAIARDVEFSFINGVYANPTTNAAPRKTRGILSAIPASNTIAGAAAPLDKTMLDNLIINMAGDSDSGAPFRNMVLMAGARQRSRISDIYGYAPESRNVGGLSINQIETDFTMIGVVFNRFMPADTVALVDVSVCQPVHYMVPGKGLFFLEELAKTGSADKWQIYGEIGLAYGHPAWHGKITGLATT